ncbi:hypothetical protein ACDA63_08475 [Uliginosibacterium sp. sgz301328]|uniref:hypothetical protein n=1 Tax=Uliginosibacterium sp. sgz301328 TaxID=3243764 RepID=UPI00359EFFEB
MRKITSTFASVNEQSGVFAGAGGYNVVVHGNTDLQGGAIVSTATPDKNYFETRTLTTSDVENYASFSSDKDSIALSYSGGTSGAGGVGWADGTLAKNAAVSVLNTPAANGQAPIEGQATGTTKSVISQGTIVITDNDEQIARTGKTADETIASINHDAETANGKIDKIFDAQQVKEQQELADLRAQTMQQAAPLLYKNVGDMLEGQDESVKVAVHALVGGLVSKALGGDFGTGAAAVGGATAAIALLKDQLDLLPDLSANERNAILQLAGDTVAYVVAGGGSQWAAAAGTAGMADTYNRMLHQNEYDKAKRYAKQVAEKLGISEQEAEERIIAEMMRNSDQQTAEATGGNIDWEIRSLIGCQNLNCDGKKDDPNYADHNFNREYIANNIDAYHAGKAQLGTGKTKAEQIAANIDGN